MDTVSRLNENLKNLNAVRKSALSFLRDITDAKSFVETGTFTSGTTFEDGVKAEGEGIITGYATVSGIPVFLFVQNFEAMRGSFSLAQAKKIESCMKMAADSGVPFISVIDSAGARLQEGAAVLEGYASVIKAAANLKNVSPHIAVVKGACVGLMSAYANLADFVIVDKNGYMSVVSPTVAAAKSDEKGSVNDLFGADVCLNNGSAVFSYDTTSELKEQIAQLLTIMSGEEEDASDSLNRTAKGLSQNATVDNVLNAVCDNSSYFELYKNYGGVRTLFSHIGGKTVGIIYAEGEMNCRDFKKIKKFENLLDGYSIPLVTFVDSQGVAADYQHEKRGYSKAVSDAFLAVALSDNKKIAVVCGNAIGIPYALLCAKQIGFSYSIAFDGASIAPISAEQAVNFADVEYGKANPIEKKKELIETYTEREGNPFLCAKDGYVDNIIKADDVRPYLCSVLSMLL